VTTTQSIPESGPFLATARPLPAPPTNGDEVLAYNTALVLSALRTLGVESATVEYDQEGRMTLDWHPRAASVRGRVVDGFEFAHVLDGDVWHERVEPWRGELTEALFRLCGLAVKLKHEELDNDGSGTLALDVNEMEARLECRDYVITTETSEYVL